MISLPKGLYVGGDLNLSGCKGLVSFKLRKKNDTKDICIITQEMPIQPVSYGEDIYDYAAFVDHYKKSGNNPMSPSEKIDI